MPPSYFFIQHDLLAYQRRKDLIFCRVDPDFGHYKRPRQKMFAKMRIGDKVMYYAVGDRVIVGCFAVVSDQFYLEDEVWGEIMARKIRPALLPTSGSFLSLEKLLDDSRISLRLFPNKEIWHSYLQGKTVRALDKHDYSLLRRALSNEKYLVKAKETRAAITTWQRKYSRLYQKGQQAV